ncbi:MAG: O-antigen ligase family protein [Nitrospira sp.]
MNARWIWYLLFLMVISGLTCDVKTYALMKFEAVIGYFFIFLVLKKEVYDLGRMKGVLATLVFVHLVVGALTPEMFSGDGERHYIASGSFLGDGNDFSLSVNIAVPFCLFLMLESQSVTKKLFYGGTLAVLVLAVVATQSRGGILALASVGFYYWLKHDRKILGVIGIVIVVAFILAVAPPQFFDRMETLTQTGEKMEGSAQGRILAWTSAIRMAIDHPFIGVGAGHFPVKYGAEYRPEGFGINEVPWQTAHSSYFLVLGELGIPGIIFLLGLIVSNLVAGERTLRKTKPRLPNSNVTSRNLVIALNASLVAFIVGGAFLSGFYYPHIYLLAALLECGRDICLKSFTAETVSRSSVSAVPIAYRGAHI